MSVVLLGLPTDRNSSFKRGPARAPAVIRRELQSEGRNPYSELGTNLKAPGIVVDAGDVPLQEDDGDFERIVAGVSAVLERGDRVVSIGGDHSVTYPVVAAYARYYDRLSIVHFDAHPDLYPVFDGNPLSHACPFARILENVGVQALMQIGIRTMTPVQREVAERFAVRDFAPWELQEARSALPGGNVYVTVDLDALDPAFAPGVSHREPGGLSVRDVLEAIRAIPGRVCGADIVELNPDEDVAGLTAGTAAKLVRELVARVHADANA